MHTTIRNNGANRAIVSAISGAVLATYSVGDAAGRTAAEASARTAYNAELSGLASFIGNASTADLASLRAASHRKAAAASDAAEFAALYGRIVAQLIADEYIE